jgi:hypothetical protein
LRHVERRPQRRDPLRRIACDIHRRVDVRTGPAADTKQRGPDEKPRNEYAATSWGVSAKDDCNDHERLRSLVGRREPP